MEKSKLKKINLSTINPLVIATTLALTSTAAFPCLASVVINEIDYDQPGTDTAEFIELFNPGTSAVSLNNYAIELINGTNSTSYRSIDLSGFSIAANGYFVVCGDASLVANCNYSFTTINSWFQNGAPDAVALYENANLLDSLSYEGLLSGFTEGNFLAVSDSNTEMMSISRMPNGFDSNDNNLDFQLGCITPGTGNISGSGDCSSASVSAVPLPAAAWLFGSGILGIAGFARRK
jgi:predicted extracellular nuclease